MLKKTENRSTANIKLMLDRLIVFHIYAMIAAVIGAIRLLVSTFTLFENFGVDDAYLVHDLLRSLEVNLIRLAVINPIVSGIPFGC